MPLHLPLAISLGEDGSVAFDGNQIILEQTFYAPLCPKLLQPLNVLPQSKYTGIHTTPIVVIIDPVLDFDPASGKISTSSADAPMDIVNKKGDTIVMILETQAHANYVTAASYLRRYLSQEHGHRALIRNGSHIKQVQKMFGDRCNIPVKDYEEAFDRL